MGKRDGNEVFKKPDGSILTKYPDRDEAILKDATRIIRYHSGKRVIHAPDKTTIHIDYDSTTRYVYPDGREKIISMDGKTPYGLKIDDLREVIRRKNFSVEVLYSADRSDEVVTPPMMKFYKEFIRETGSAMSKNAKSLDAMKIVISHCRFCSTGYCRRKNRKEVSVTAFRNGGVHREVVLDYEDLLRRDGHIAEAKKAAAGIFR